VSILDKAKPERLYNFTSYERLYRSVAFDQMRKDKDAQRLALLSVADPQSYTVKEQAK
jgi:hypothetical protein